MNIIAKDDAFDIVAVSQDVQASTQAEILFNKEVLRAATETASVIDKPVVIFSNLTQGMHPEIVAEPKEAGLPILQGTRESLRALAHWGRFGENRRRYARMASIDAAVPQPAKVRAVLSQVPPGETLVSAGLTKRLLLEYGIPVPRETLVATAREAADAARRIGFPVVLKIESPDLIHKSDVGGVIVALDSADAVEMAFAQLMASVRSAAPNIRVEGVLVAEQAQPGTELFLGIGQDPQFGPVVLCGLGGILVEVLDCVAIGLPPIDEELANDLVRSFRGNEVLEGFRGSDPVDVKTLKDVLVKLGNVAIDGEGLFDVLEINPFIATTHPNTSMAVDARMLMRAGRAAPEEGAET